MYLAVSSKQSSDQTWLGRMLIVVKDQHIRGGSLCGNDTVVLGHVAGSINLSFMVDLNLNLYFPTYGAKSTKLYKRTHSGSF